MEIINQKEVKIFVIVIALLTLFATIVPVIMYFIHFDGEFSDLQSDWGTFGDYIGGVIGTVFSLITAVFAFTSIYISLKIATRIQETELKFNSDNASREAQRFEKEIELTHKQNKAFPYLDLSKFSNETSIVLWNYGTGPLVIEKWEIIYKDETFAHFNQFFRAKIKASFNEKQINYSNNTSPAHILPPNGARTLLSVLAKEEERENFEVFQRECRQYLSDAELHFHCKDIFENQFTFKKNLKFFNDIN